MGTVLYVTEPGACVHQTHGRLRVTKGKTLLAEVRIAEVERVVLVGGTAGVTNHAATALMEAGIETAFLSSSGTFRGWLAPAKGRGVTLRLAQFRAHSDPAFRLTIARAIVAQKIKNGDAVLARFARNHPSFDPVVERERMRRVIDSARVAESVESLLGYEGSAAAAYFAAFGRMLGNGFSFAAFGRMLGNGFSFAARSRRPPADAANALLSLGYTLLSAEATGAVAGAGLDPALGMLHTPEDGRPALGLDLTEEFRQPVVDRLVLSLANNRILSPTADFERGEGFRLTAAARKRFYRAYEERMTERFSVKEGGPLTSLRKQLRHQARLLALALRDGGPYRPFALRL